ncbi:MAG TPA: DUF1877 family protein [Caulobacteraceae bacterium]|jgi:hypothetical protein
MSLICYYVRAAPNCVTALTLDELFSEEAEADPRFEMIDIDKAHEALAWLASPLKRLEVEHDRRQRRDLNWPDDAQRASVARLNAMEIDGALAAIQGAARERTAFADPQIGTVAMFSPARVVELSDALGTLDQERLRQELDFQVMDADDVGPGSWLEDGEALFRTYLLPNLMRLKQFYEAAVAERQAVFVLWT